MGIKISQQKGLVGKLGIDSQPVDVLTHIDRELILLFLPD